MAFVAPLVIQLARMVATRYLARSAAARLATGAAAGRLGTAALRGRQYMQSPAANTSLVRNVPGLRRAASQPRFFGRGTATNPTIWSRFNTTTTTRNLPLQTSATGRPYVSVPSGTTRVQAPFVSRGVSQAPVTYTSPASTSTKISQTLRSPVRGLTRLATPRNLAAEAEFTAYAFGADAIRRNQQNQNNQPSSTPTPRPTSGTPSGTTPNTTTTYDPTRPIRPGNNPYAAGRAPATLSAPGNRQRGNQPTTLTPGSVPAYTPPTLTLPASPPTPPSVPSVPESQAAADANMRNFQDELNRIQGTYGSLVEQIRGAYNLAPTEEEKELLLNDLADLEAENEAAKLALSQLFAEKDKTVGALAAKSKEYATERSQGIGQLYADAGQELRDFDAMRLAEVAEGIPGYGAAVGRDSNLNAELLSTMAPIAQSYSQQIGDIGTQGLDYIRGLTQGVGAARGGELQSQYASSRAGIRSNWSDSVIDRIANERLQMASALGDLASRQLGIMGAMSPPTSTGPTTADIYEAIDQLASTPGMTDEAFEQWMQQYFPGRSVQDLDLQTFSGIQDYLNQQEAVQNQGGVDALLQFFPGMNAEQAMEAFNNMPESQQALLLNLIQIQ